MIYSRNSTLYQHWSALLDLYFDLDRPICVAYPDNTKVDNSTNRFVRFLRHSFRNGGIKQHIQYNKNNLISHKCAQKLTTN